MRIGIDARGLRSSLDGIGRYTRNLIQGLLKFDRESEYVLFVLPGVDFSFLPSSERVTTVVHPHRHLSLNTAFRFGEVIWRAGLDLLHIPFFVGPRRFPVPTIVTVHDLMALTYPRFFSGRSLPAELSAKAFHRFFVPGTVRRAGVVFADSEYTRERIVEVLGVSEERIEVVYPFVDDRFRAPVSADAIRSARESLRVRSAYILFFGNTKPYKNLAGLLAGYADLLARGGDPSPQLVILGPPDRFRSEVEEKAASLGIREQVVFGGQVADTALIPLMKGALALCFPSLEEGFGLPVLEAMSVGTPVVTSRVSSLPEVAGEAALFVDPRDPSDIGEALHRLTENPSLREDLIAKGRLQAEKFDPRRILGQVLDTYRRVASV